MNSPETRFSVIIPLECHRGQTELCLDKWLNHQTYSRSLYEVVAVAPDDISLRERRKLEALLTAPDRLIIRPEQHDMALCVAGAEAATGDVLFFTESHCWPEADALEKIATALRANPEWAGLSCRSVPVTHNRLSVVEAEMYEADIEYGMLRHPWRKILDQCFAVRREAYFRAGGFEADLGHYAEWLLAARFFQMGMSVGYAPEARVHHFYSGDLHEWRVFTRDFAEGEIRFHSRQSQDPCEKLLPQVPEWKSRQAWSRRSAMGMLKVLWQERAFANMRTPDEAHAKAGGKIRHWLTAAIAGVWPAWLRACLECGVLRIRLGCLLHFGEDKKLKRAYADYCAALIHVSRLRFLRCEIKARENGEIFGKQLVKMDAGEWRPGENDDWSCVGFHLVEEWCGRKFRWSEPVAMIEIPLVAGEHRVSLDLLPVLPPETRPKPRFYFNEFLLPGGEIESANDKTVIRVRVLQDGFHRLAWSCPSFCSPGDDRKLGLPLHRISWQSTTGKSAGLQNVKPAGIKDSN